MNAQSFLDKSISMTMEEAPIAEVLLELSDIANINITFSPSLFEKNPKININVEKVSLQKVLNQCLIGTRIGYKTTDNGIILFRKPTRKFSLSGYIMDSETGERLVGANIIELKNLNGNSSNNFGFYSHKFNEGEIELQVSYLGYQTEFIKTKLIESKTLNIQLKPSLTLKEIVVVSKKDSVLVRGEDMKTVLPLKRLSHLPATAGEADIMRYLQLLPGVNSGADGFGGLHVRGGNSDQNLILLDDVPIFNPSHTFGLFSIFNSDLVKSVQFYKGQFPARYDSRISSILDIRTREANINKFSGKLTLGTIASRGLVEIPFAKKGGILLASRFSHINAWLKPYGERTKRTNGTLGENGETDYKFRDFNIKAHYALGKRNKIYLSYYQGRDDFFDNSFFDDPPPEEMSNLSFLRTTDYKMDWGNRILSFRWNHLLSDKIFFNTTATFSNFIYTSTKNTLFQLLSAGEPEIEVQENSFYSSEITDLSLRTDMDYFINNEHHLQLGANIIYRTFTPGLEESILTNDEIGMVPDLTDNRDLKAIEVSEFNLYAEEKFKKKNWILDAGIRLVAHLIDGKFRLIPQPRLFSSYTFHKHLILKTSILRTAQFMHLLTRADSGLPNDLWVPSGKNTTAQKAWQITTGASGQLTQNFQFNTEIYWKKTNGLLQFDQEKIGDVLSLNDLKVDGDNWESLVEEGFGETIGIETTIEKNKGKLTGWMSYALAKSTRIFSQNKIPFRFDSRHTFTFASTFQINKWMDVSLTWLYQTGRPFLPDELGEDDVPFVNILQNTNAPTNLQRFPAYHRLDTAVNFNLGKKKLKHKIQVSLYNAFNRKNIFFPYLVFDPVTGEYSEIKSVYGLPLIPSLSYSLVW